jgi:hypothetical protein
MWHAMVTSIALLVAAQGRADVKAEKASEAGGWLAPTRIRLDFRDSTLAEIVNGINAQGPEMLAFLPEPRGFLGDARRAKPGPPPRRYSIREPGTITFWEAVDRIGRATETWPVSGNRPSGRLGILLQPASSDRGFVCNDGAFRIALTGTYYQSNFQFAPHFFYQPGLEQPRPDGSSRRPSLSANLTIMAEPRLKIVGPVELLVREAVDDRGRNLIPAAPWRQSLRNPPVRAIGFPNEEFITIALKASDDPGKQIKRLAGSVTLEVAESQPGSPGAMVEVGFDFADVPLP